MSAETAKVGVVLGGGAMRHKTTGEHVYFLGRLDLDHPDDGPEEIAIDFLAHGITPHPQHPRHAVLFEKHGPGCCVVDLDAGRVLQTIRCKPGREFYGHGAFSLDGSLLFCTETDVRDGNKGYITVRDGRDYGSVGDFPSHGLAPHDCMFADDGQILVVANGGSSVGRDDGPNVAYVDVNSGALRERLVVPNPAFNAGHLAMGSAGQLAVVSAPRDGLDPQRSCGGISWRQGGGELQTPTQPSEILDQLFGETLSVALHEPTGVVGATTPLGNLVTFWKLQTGQLVHKLRVPNPRGIAISQGGDEFIINFGSPPRAARVAASNLQPVDAPGNRRGYPSLATGSHIFIDDASAIARA